MTLDPLWVFLQKAGAVSWYGNSRIPYNIKPVWFRLVRVGLRAFRDEGQVPSLLRLFHGDYRHMFVYSGSKVINWEALRYYDTLRKVRYYVSSHYADALPLTEVGHACGIEPKYLSQLFHKKVGITLTEYIGLIRLRAALEMMRRTDRRCVEIALSVGFGSVRTFERACRKYLGTSPRVLQDKFKPRRDVVYFALPNCIPETLWPLFFGDEVESSSTAA
jgi:AraC-like DNA-binding protein